MSNYIKNVAIVGAGGNSGEAMTRELLRTGKHVVTAITRADSQSKLPDGVGVARVDYEDPSTIVNALRGQDALIITLSVTAPDNIQSKLVKAASDAGVPWVLPNEWSPDSTHEGLAQDIPRFSRLGAMRQEIETLGDISYVGLSTGFWYGWSLAIPAAFGFDFEKKSVTFFDEGEVKICTSTWPQVGRGVAALLSLPIQPEGNDSRRCLQHFRNQQVYISSFTVSQKDMFESVLRVTKTKPEEWSITKEPSTQRYAEGFQAMKEGDRMGFVRAMYTRVFYPDDSGNHEKTKGTSNELLGLPKEDLDEATEAAIERAKVSKW